MTLKDKLKDYHKLIMTLEIAGLLHDTGKLDSRFIDYRRKWQEGKDGWNYYNDPHDDEEKPFFDHDPLLHEFETLRNTLSKNISVFCGREEIWINGHRLGLNISLKELVHQHTRAVHDLSKFLKFGDSIDSAYDRNNPLMVMEQKNQELFMSTVFGYESPLKVALFDNSRKLLYCQLNTLLLDYLSNLEPDKRRKIFNRFEDAFKIGITDTCRPANDIPLWQHVYMTTALCKIFFLHFLIYGELFKRYEDCRFSLLGFGWNGLGFISKGHKIGDVVARKEIIKILKKKIKEIVEYSYPIGMNVYDDDNGIYFIIPAILEDKKGVDEYKGLLQEIRERVLEVSNDFTGGEIIPVVSKRVKETHYIMDIIRVIDEIKKKSQYPYSNSKACWIELWGEGKVENEICSVCQCRSLIGSQTVCNICMERRKFAQHLRGKKESVFTEEIADKNGRLALIVAKFNLEPWLSGDMLWSLFVKESDSLKRALAHLGEIEDLKETDEKRLEKIKDKIKNIKSFSYNYEEIKKHIDDCQNDSDFARAIVFLFDRHGKSLKLPEWKGVNKWIEEISQHMEIEKRFNKKPDLYNYLLTKNHTPSRLLNAWNITREFLDNIFKIEKIKAELPSFNRIELVIDKSPSEVLPNNNAIYEAIIDGERIEVLREDENIFLVTQRKELDLLKKEVWKGKEIIIAVSEFEKKKGREERKAKIQNIRYGSEAIYPYQVITTSPDLLMALVPGDKAVEISNLIYQEYLIHFGKVRGRLPFSIANIFFPKKTPMFVVLDAGKRMAENFAKRYKDYLEKGGNGNTLTVKNIEKDKDENTTAILLENNIRWELNQSLGNGEIDWFHPYLIVEDDRKDVFYNTFLGDLVHFSKVEKGFKIKFYPNYYDFEFLDSTTRRYDIALDNYQRKSNVTNLPSKPYFLDELKQKIEEIWNILRKNELGMTDTKLRNIESLWLTKLKEWQVDLNKKDSDNFKQWAQLVESTLKQEFENEKLREELKESICSGLFFDCLELNLRILKKKVKEKDNETK